MNSRLEYAKKKDKKAQIKFIKDERIVKDDVYKSHTVHVPSGEPPGSLSRPPAKRKPGIVRPITQGKLLRAGGPSEVRRVARSQFLVLANLTSLEAKSCLQTQANCKTTSWPVHAGCSRT